MSQSRGSPELAERIMLVERHGPLLDGGLVQPGLARDGPSGSTTTFLSPKKRGQEAVAKVARQVPALIDWFLARVDLPSGRAESGPMLPAAPNPRASHALPTDLPASGPSGGKPAQ